MNKGPTDTSIRKFIDSYDEVKRYQKKNKKERKKTRDALKELTKMNPKDLEEDDDDIY